MQSLTYWTLVGRVDQFLLGILAYQYRDWFVQRHAFVWAVLLSFSVFYAWLDWRGGFYLQPSYPSPSPVWICLPALEGAWVALIAWYEGAFRPCAGGISGFLAGIGAYSCSIYLLHFFVVFRAADWVNQNIMAIANFYVALPWAGVFFLLMWPVGYLSFRFIESPFFALAAEVCERLTKSVSLRRRAQFCGVGFLMQLYG